MFTCFEDHVSYGLVLWSSSPCSITQGVLVLQKPLMDIQTAAEAEDEIPHATKHRLSLRPKSPTSMYFKCESVISVFNYFQRALLLIDFFWIGCSLAKALANINFISCRLFYKNFHLTLDKVLKSISPYDPTKRFSKLFKAVSITTLKPPVGQKQILPTFLVQITCFSTFKSLK